MQDGFNWGDAGGGFLGEYTELERKGACQLALQVDRAAAHARDYAGMLHFGAFEFDQDDGLAGAEKIGHYTDDFQIELFDLVAREDGVGVAVHAGLHLAQRQDLVGLLPTKGWCQGRDETDHYREDWKTAGEASTAGRGRKSGPKRDH